MKIEVTQEDIQNGIHSNPSCCPIALACQRQLHRNDIQITGGLFVWANNIALYKMPKQCAKFVGNFDAGVLVEPFTFELENVF